MTLLDSFLRAEENEEILLQDRFDRTTKHEFMAGIQYLTRSEMY